MTDTIKHYIYQCIDYRGHNWGYCRTYCDTGGIPGTDATIDVDQVTCLECLGIAAQVTVTLVTFTS